MSACIIQQLFRQIVGQGLDYGLVDDILFPMLRSREELVRELSQDIKLVDKIMGEDPFYAGDFPVPVFRPPSKPYPGKRVRRSRVLRNEWTSIDILNELRELKRPWIGGGYRYSGRGLVGDRFADFYINFKENEERLNIQKAAKNITIPHLVIHGDVDTSVSIKEGENLHQWNAKSEFEIIKNADHIFNVSHPWKKPNMSKELKSVTNLCINFLR